MVTVLVVADQICKGFSLPIAIFLSGVGRFSRESIT